MLTKTIERRAFPSHGWLGMVLMTVFWTLNWSLVNVHTNWCFFPMWLGYCLTVDGLVFWRKGTSLFTRDWRKYLGLFIISAPVWWAFEVVNWRLQNWEYLGVHGFTPFQFWAWSTLNFSSVIPAVFGSAELVGSFDFIRKAGRGLVIRPNRMTTCIFFISGLIMFVMMWIWPRIFFPFVWISLYIIIEPLNVWLGNHHLAQSTKNGDWRPVYALWIGVLCTAFFWEMWNYLSYPKWIYHVAWGNAWHIFEMPLLGYGGYLPFSLELYAVYHLVMGFIGHKNVSYVKLIEY